jgi:hypothetical protein
MTIRRLLAVALCLTPVGAARAQTAADSAAIYASSRAYIDAVWESDSARLRRVLHPELVKRQVLTGRGGAADRLSELNTRQMLISHGQSDEPPPANRQSDVTILHILGNMATVVIDAGMWVDYVHLARLNGEYKIFNIMYDFRRGP